MRQAGTISDRALAQRIADYLTTLGMDSRVDEGENGWVVWVLDDQHWQRARAEVAAFQADPGASRYAAAEAQAREIRLEQSRRQQEYARNVVDVRERWRPWTQGSFPLTIALIVACVGVTLASDLSSPESPLTGWLKIDPGPRPAPRRVTEKPAILERLPAVSAGQVWRLVTPIFLHNSWMHLLFNMYMAWQLGALIETRRGTLSLLGIVLFTAVCSNLTQFFASGPNFVGLSGVIYGFFGYAWMKSRFDPNAGILIPPDLVFLLLVWLVLGYTGILDEWVGAIANWAHAGGLVAGMALGFGPVALRKIMAGSRRL